MIQVNLLPLHLRPIRRSSLPYMVTALIVACALGVMIWRYTDTATAVANLQQRLDGNNKKLAELKPVLDEAIELEMKKEGLKSKILAIESITKDRVIWSEQLHHITRLLPANFWLREIKIDKKKDKRIEKVPKITGATTTMVDKEVPFDIEILKIIGYVSADVAGNMSANPLMFALDTDPEFTKLFTIDQPTIGPADFEGYPVTQYMLEYRIGAKTEGQQ